MKHALLVWAICWHVDVTSTGNTIIRQLHKRAGKKCRVKCFQDFLIILEIVAN